MKKYLNIRGEILAETIIALSVLAIGITISGTTILNSIRNLSNAKSRVLAVNIAREGIEAMRNIRDTNWLFYSDKRRQCWNHNPSMGDCDGTEPIEPGVYIIYKDTNDSWQIASADVNTSLDGSDQDGITNNDVDAARARLSLVDIDNTLNSDNAGGDNDDRDMYNHKHDIATNSLGTETVSTPFTRYILVEYLTNDGVSIVTLTDWSIGDVSELNRMRISSVVEWTRGATHKAELKTIITDHLGRTDLNESTL